MFSLGSLGTFMPFLELIGPTTEHEQLNNLGDIYFVLSVCNSLILVPIRLSHPARRAWGRAPRSTPSGVPRGVATRGLG